MGHRFTNKYDLWFFANKKSLGAVVPLGVVGFRL